MGPHSAIHLIWKQPHDNKPEEQQKLSIKSVALEICHEEGNQEKT